jgi:hypothetical protein
MVVDESGQSCRPSSPDLLLLLPGALGLDLSFVRHIFLMEPLADAALEQQVGLETLNPYASASQCYVAVAQQHRWSSTCEANSTANLVTFGYLAGLFISEKDCACIGQM